MKSIVRAFLAILFVAGILFANFQDISTVSADIGNGKWILPESNDPFTIVKIDKELEIAPVLQQQFSEGIKIESPNLICYTFRGGDYGWVPQIRRYKNNMWVKIPTTTDHVFGIEAPLYACAEAPSSGLYALFASYTKPACKVVSVAPPAGFDCSTITWTHSGSPGALVTSTTSAPGTQHWEFSGTVTGVPASTTISWGVTEASQSFYVAANGYAGSTTLDGDNNFYVSRYISTSEPFTVLTVLFTESSHGCTHTAYLQAD